MNTNGGRSQGRFHAWCSLNNGEGHTGPQEVSRVRNGKRRPRTADHPLLSNAGRLRGGEGARTNRLECQLQSLDFVLSEMRRVNGF